MTDKTFSRRLQQLIEQLQSHPHRDEILELAQSQLLDDVNTVPHWSDKVS